MKRKLLKILAASSVICGLFGCGKRAPQTNPAEEKKFLDARQSTADWQATAKDFDKHKAEAVKLFAGATKVEVFRVVPEGREKPVGSISDAYFGGKKAAGGVANFACFAVEKEQGPGFAARLGAVLFNPKSYERPGTAIKSCYIDPAVVFRVWKQERYMDAMICFQCSELAVFEYDTKAPDRSIGGHVQGKFYVSGDFDSVRPALIALTQEAMPNDPVFSKL